MLGASFVQMKEVQRSTYMKEYILELQHKNYEQSNKTWQPTNIQI